jgi:hypothetical protein
VDALSPAAGAITSSLVHALCDREHS